MAYEAEFEEFWRRYPKKVAKFAAKKSYDKARRGGASHVQLLAGVSAYLKHKPEYADFCHAATWLNQGRWMDEWPQADVRSVAPESDWFDECKRIHKGECGLSRWKHHERKKIDELKRASA